MQRILKFLTLGIYKGKKMKKGNEGFFTRLLKEDNNLSILNFFLISTLAVGVFLLFIPVVGMLVDIFYNHTITIDLSGMAMYIGAVAAIFASGGLTSAWTEFSYSKYDVPAVDDDGQPCKTKRRRQSDDDMNIEYNEIDIEENPAFRGSYPEE